MSASLSFSEPVGAVLTDHELVAQYQACVHQMYNRQGVRAARQAKSAVRHFLQYKVVSHFAYEEEYVLPGLLHAAKTPKAARLIAQLWDEHRVLQKKADQLDALLVAPAPARAKGPPPLQEALRDFFHDLQKHADLENELFPTLLSRPAPGPARRAAAASR